ncbi:PadR family transcriptional regulator [Actinoplanes sp. NPDC051859]|uniref:PadR family transcriptional regulator n=1 Tax=Actinoplanes sp. NPDC051859 TaxID=3363909 RepID=UPI0037B3A92E
MTTPHVLMGLLAAGPRHGYDLKRAHDERLPRAKPLAYGQVYATLGRLVRDGLVEQHGQDREGGPDRTSYALTETGRARLTEWLTTVEPPAPYVTSALFAKVMICLLAADPATTADYVAAQRAAHAARIRELTVIKRNRASPVADVVAADYAIGHLDADLRWLQTTLLRVSELHREVNA